MERNYRSTQRILSVANGIIKNNKSSKGKKLWTDGNKGEKIKVYNATNTYDEANYITNEIKLKKNENISYKDITILYRTNAQSRILEERLLAGNIPYKIYGGMQFFQRKEIKDILGYMNLLNNSDDNLNFLRIINVPKRSIGDKTIERLVELSNSKGISLLESLNFTNELDGIRSGTIAKLDEFYNLFSSIYEKLDEMTVKEVLQEILSKTKYIESLEENQEDRIRNIEELLNSITEMERESPGLTLSEYLDTISLSSSIDSLEEEDNHVKLMTIHSSKGLEFDYVFIAGMEDGLFPSDKGDATDEEIEEERRLCYVAITRAKKELTISYANERMIWGQYNYMRNPSRFISEMNRDELEFIKQLNEKTEIRKINSENYKKIENINPNVKNVEKKSDNLLSSKYKKGEYVTHIKFGKGRITDIDAKSITVDFMTGEKKIALVLVDRFLV